MQIYFSQNIRFFSHCIWKKKLVLKERHQTVCKDISSTTLETFSMNFDPKVVVVNSEISSCVMQHAGTRLGRYGSGEVSGKKGSLCLEIFLRKYST